MMRIVSSLELLKILEERRAKLTGVEERVAEIIRRVKEDGEPALRMPPTFVLPLPIQW